MNRKESESGIFKFQAEVKMDFMSQIVTQTGQAEATEGERSSTDFKDPSPSNI